MKPPDHVVSHLTSLGFEDLGGLHYSLFPAPLYEEAITRGEGIIAQNGPLAVRTDPHTGRSARDRFLVRDQETDDVIAWGDENIATEVSTFDQMLDRMCRYAAGQDLFIQDVYAGTDPDYWLPVRIVTEKAWHSLFAYNMFVRRPADMVNFRPAFTLIDLSDFKANPEDHGTRSEAFIMINVETRLVLIGGTHYAGEIKKSIFAAMNYILPAHGVLPMHCSANEGVGGDVAIFFRLSGTGKTSLSADNRRTLIGDDEHGWGDDGIFNFEGGCYAKTIRLSAEEEPEIYGATDRFGTILENVTIDDDTRAPNFDDASITQNTRASYPLHHIANASPTGRTGHADNVIFLTYDAFGVLPPISRLSPSQEMYHFLSGYTAKVAGTEKGVSEPKAVFSACFGAPFMVRHPFEYAELLGEKIRQHGASCWLINTGITGGAHDAGDRIKLAHTRAMVDAVLSGALDKVDMRIDELFGLSVPEAVPGVPGDMLHPRSAWKKEADYNEQARQLAGMFAENFQRFADDVPEDVAQGGPTLGTVGK